MRKEYKIFALMVCTVALLSLSYNINKLFDYVFFSYEVNEKLFGFSYTIPLVVCAYMICKNARTGLEKFICKVFLWISISALCDELLFDPFKPQVWEHIVGLLITLTIIYNARIKKNRN